MSSGAGRQEDLERLRRARAREEKPSDQVDTTVASVYEVVPEEEYNAEIAERKARGSFVEDDLDGAYDSEDGDDDDDRYLARNAAAAMERKRRQQQAKRRAQQDREKDNKAPPKKQGRMESLFGNSSSSTFLGREGDSPLSRSFRSLGSLSSSTPSGATTTAGSRRTEAPAATNLAKLLEAPDFKELLQEAGQIKKDPARSSSAAAGSRKMRLQKRAQGQTFAAAPAKSKAEYTEVKVDQPFSAEKEGQNLSAPSPQQTKSAPNASPVITSNSSNSPNSSASSATITKPVTASSDMDTSSVKMPDVNDVSSTSRRVLDKLPLSANGTLQFYWLDAAENVSAAQPNTVHLFGKVFVPELRDFVSCCVVIRDVPRVAYAAPREPVLDEEGEQTPFAAAVEAELAEIKTKYRLQSVQAKPVSRNYAFELRDVPFGLSSFMKTKILGNTASVPVDLSGKTFTHFIGLSAGPLEQVLLKCDLKGPRWLCIEKPRYISARTTWCALEAEVSSYKDVRHSDSMRPVWYTLAAVSLETYVNERGHREIAAATVCVQKHADLDNHEHQKGADVAVKTAVRRMSQPFPLEIVQQAANSESNLVLCNSTKELLEFVFGTIGSADPDILLGFDCLKVDFEVLLHQASLSGVSGWSRLGRLRLSQVPKGGVMAACHGRLVCDVFLLAQEFIGKQKNYSLPELAKSQLGESEHRVIDIGDVLRHYASPALLSELVTLDRDRARLTMRIADVVKMISVTKQITELVGNLWSRTLCGHRAERVEYLLLHEFHRQKFVLPDKRYARNAPLSAAGPYSGASRSGNVRDNRRDEGYEDNDDDNDDEENANVVARPRRRKAAYVGGKVLEPKVGFYDRLVVLVDFHSLYPSLIQEYNVCFTTVQRLENSENNANNDGEDNEEKGEKNEGTDWIAKEPDPKIPEGILPRVIRTLVSERSNVRAQMKGLEDGPVKRALHIRQLALKVVANSLYGVLGFEFSRFYARPLAELVTRKGRETLIKSMEIVEGKGFQVIYGDTDSLMINTGAATAEEARKVAVEVLKDINAQYHALELDIEAIYSRLLLIRKKSYACLDAESGKKTIKGMYLVRRDWCDLAKDAGKFLLEQLLTESLDRDQVPEALYTYLRRLSDDIRSSRIPLEKYGISKLLSKDPSSYADSKAQAHVIAAKHLREIGGKIGVGDYVTYAVCLPPGSSSPENTSSSSSALAYAYTLEEMRKRPELKINTEWYIATQVLPPLSRLCRPLVEIEPERVIESLGLDVAKYSGAFRSTAYGAGPSSMGTDDPNSLASLMGDMDPASDKLIENLHSFSANVQTQLDQQLCASAEHLLIHCPFKSCRNKPPFEFRGTHTPCTTEGNGLLPNEALCCPYCHQSPGAACVANQVILLIRDHIRRLYTTSSLCDSLSCTCSTHSPLLYQPPAAPACLRCPACRQNPSIPAYIPRYLYAQIRSLRSLFVPASQPNSLGVLTDRRLTEEQKTFFNQVKVQIDQYIQKCALNFFSLSAFAVGSLAQDDTSSMEVTNDADNDDMNDKPHVKLEH